MLLRELKGLPLLPEETPDFRAGSKLGQRISLSVGREVNRNAFFDAWREVVDFGLLSLLIPEELLETERVLSVMEGVGSSCDNAGFLLAVAAHCFGVGAPLRAFARPDQMHHLAAMRKGETIAALAATEPEAGSDLMSLTTRYRTAGENYVIEGKKCYITNIAEADLFLVLATKDPRLHFRGITAFLVPGDAPGLIIGPNEPRLGLHGCSLGLLTLSEVVVPNSSLLGTVGAGATVFRQAMIWERSLIALPQLGLMRRKLLYSLSHVKARRQFDRPIGSNQYVAGRLVDAIMRYTTSRLLVRDTLLMLAENKLSLGQASLTKLHVSESVLASCMDAFRLQGGAGFVGNEIALQHVIDSLAATIYSGTSDLQKVIVASELGLAV